MRAACWHPTNKSDRFKYAFANAYAVKHNVGKAKAYNAVLKTAEGKTLYRESLL